MADRPLRAALSWLAALACVSFPAGALRAQAAPAEPTVRAAPADLQRTCEEFRAAQGIVGMGVAVLEDGKVVFDAAFGMADREAKRAATPQTLFRLGSIAKPVAATIAMQLVDDKELDLDADVRTRLPDLAERLAPMTVRQLLSHTAGIRHYRPDRRDNATAHRTTAQALELFLGDPLVAEPGTRHSYSTHGYTVVAAVLEASSGKTFVELVRERIAARGCAALDCEVSADDKPARSALYERERDGTVAHRPAREDLSWKYAGGGMESTALDLARFGDGVRSATLCSAAGRDAMWTRTKLTRGSEVAYGLGWRVAEDGTRMHTGAQQGAQSALVVMPEQGVVIAVLTNTTGTKPQELVPRVQEIVRGATAKK
jgi:CubicO group peptidase (beta-lactamase class C family)